MNFLRYTLLVICALFVRESFGSAARLDADFQRAAEYVVNNVNEDASPLLKLEYYANFKQATKGPCRIPRPSIVTESAKRLKWNAWNGLGDKSKSDAKRDYIALLTRDVPDWKN
jgi:acyl-CoA-binding protein